MSQRDPSPPEAELRREPKKGSDGTGVRTDLPLGVDPRARVQVTPRRIREGAGERGSRERAEHVAARRRGAMRSSTTSSMALPLANRQRPRTPRTRPDSSSRPVPSYRHTDEAPGGERAAPQRSPQIETANIAAPRRKSALLPTHACKLLVSFMCSQLNGGTFEPRTLGLLLSLARRPQNRRTRVSSGQVATPRADVLSSAFLPLEPVEPNARLANNAPALRGEGRTVHALHVAAGGRSPDETFGGKTVRRAQRGPPCSWRTYMHASTRDTYAPSHARFGRPALIAHSHRQVTCTFSQDCVLPCSFEPTGSAANISWHRQDSPVLFFDGSGRSAERQSPHYMGRTSLFWERVSHGNASLQLRSVNTADRGRYRCRVSTEQGARDAFIIARVEAPVSSLTLEVTRRSGHKELRCSSQDIYPAPQLWWSTEPPVRPEALKHTTRKRANEQGLYSIESTVDAADGLSEHSYVCAMNSSYGSQTWRASLREREMKTAEGQQLTIPCVVPDNLHNFTLAWSFTKEDRTALILTFNSRTRHVADNWASRAQVDPAQVMSGDGSLRLRDPDSSAHTGTYSCAFSAPRTHYLVRTRVNVTAPESGMSLRRPSKRSLMLLSRYSEEGALSHLGANTLQLLQQQRSASAPWFGVSRRKRYPPGHSDTLDRYATIQFHPWCRRSLIRCAWPVCAARQVSVTESKGLLVETESAPIVKDSFMRRVGRSTDSRPRGADEETTEMQPMRTGGHAEESGKPGVLGS
ncbi:hypothetical protein Z043_120355 [Scleropages formosus]|uniref:Ig-like domain-containing protein n=1 Tax=Scleropages formosus TaxID=113540 RepID=A0A0P7UJN2_SCLFO|nr:hypothetical protein Z043_120355 [Scleropages formosus]